MQLIVQFIKTFLSQLITQKLKIKFSVSLVGIFLIWRIFTLVQVSDSFRIKMISCVCEICFRIVRNLFECASESYGVNGSFGMNLKNRTVPPKKFMRRRQISHSFVIDRTDFEMYGLERNQFHSETSSRVC